MRLRHQNEYEMRKKQDPGKRPMGMVALLLCMSPRAVMNQKVYFTL